jgi:hypothetical protein
MAKKLLSPVTTEGTPESNQEGTPKKSPPPLNSQSNGLGTTGGVPTGGDSTQLLS